MPCLLAKHNFHKIVLVGFNIYRVNLPYEISSIRKGGKYAACWHDEQLEFYRLLYILTQRVSVVVAYLI